MKYVLKPTLLVMLLSFSLAATANSFSKTPEKSNHIEKTNEEEAKKLIDRLEEIKSMDPSGMTRKEKREAKREVKSIERTLETMNGGVYLSVGAVIIIILLLILLL